MITTSAVLLATAGFFFTYLTAPFGGLSDAAHTKGKINITIRDSFSGHRIAGELRSNSSRDVMRLAANDRGEAALEVSGRTELTVSAEGYDPISTYFDIDGNGLEVTVWLDPADQQARFAADSEDLSEVNPDQTVFEGFVFDSRGAPIGNAVVSIAGMSTVTTAEGAFRLVIETPEPDRETELPAEGTLTVQRQGATVYTKSNVFLEGGKSRFIIDLSDDRKTVDGRHRFRLGREEVEGSFERPEIAEPFFLNRPDAVPVPASIRVGSSCPSAVTCSIVNVYSIDTYVRNGLDDEWIASWNANSVKAGAIAYRSYGAYHVYHPRVAASYDICNTTSCQVNDPSDTHTNTNNATVQTTGSVVTNAAGTDILFAEYSAENNLAPGCPDGSTGRPEHNWPCLADPVDAGTTYFGHGRGMCQWGSQRWSVNQGKDFVWVVNHYYNANGNPAGLRNGVLQLGAETLLPPPELTGPGAQTAPGTTVSTLTPTFEWQPVAGADGYSLYLSKFNGSTYDLVFNSETVLGAPIVGTSFTLPSGILTVGGEYRWNMSAHIPVGYGTPNTFRNYFRVGTTTTISGRVTSPTGLNIRNALVTITDSSGNRRTATTSSFGIYSFADVALGETHTVTAATKRYRFTPQVIQVTGNLANVDFTGLE